MPMATSLPMTCTATIVTASHCVGLTLPGMMDEPGSLAGMAISPSPVARTRGKPAHIVRELHHVARERLDRAVREHQLILRRERVELVGRGDKGLSGQIRDGRGDRPVKAVGGVESRADRRAAERQLPQGRQRGGEQARGPVRGSSASRRSPARR